MNNKYRLFTESHGNGCEYDDKAAAERNATWLSFKLEERVFIQHKGKVIGSIFAAQESQFSYNREVV